MNRYCFLPTAYCLLLIAAVTAGCASLPLRTGADPSAPSFATDPYYSYAPRAVRATQTLLRTTRRFRQWQVTFPSAQPVLAEQETVTCEWFEPTRPGRHPAILVYPILGGDYPIERGCAEYFARHGWHAVLIHREKYKFTRERGIDYLEGLFRQGILKGRQVVDWLTQQPGVDAAHLGGFGISMGGIQAVITAACEPRLTAHVICLAGGPVAELLTVTRDRVVARPRARYLEETGHDLAWLRAETARALRSDPVALAPAVRTSQVLCMTAAFDRTIPRHLSRRLWEALGRPRRLTVPFGHYTSILAMPYIRWRARQWYRAQWDVR